MAWRLSLGRSIRPPNDRGRESPCNGNEMLCVFKVVRLEMELPRGRVTQREGGRQKPPDIRSRARVT